MGGIREPFSTFGLPARVVLPISCSGLRKTPDEGKPFQPDAMLIDPALPAPNSTAEICGVSHGAETQTTWSHFQPSGSRVVLRMRTLLACPLHGWRYPPRVHKGAQCEAGAGAPRELELVPRGQQGSVLAAPLLSAQLLRAKALSLTVRAAFRRQFLFPLPQF